MGLSRNCYDVLGGCYEVARVFWVVDRMWGCLVVAMMFWWLL